MKKRLVVDVLIDDTVSEEEVLTRVDDILADCALRPAEFTDLELDPNNPIVWDDEDDPANIPGWQPSPGTALDYVYRKKYLDKHGLSESKKKVLKEDKEWPPKAQAVFDRLVGINSAEELGWGEYFEDSSCWGDTDFMDGCCCAFTDNFDENDPYWDSYNEDDFKDDSDFIDYVKGNKKLFKAAKADLDAYVKAWDEEGEEFTECDSLEDLMDGINSAFKDTFKRKVKFNNNCGYIETSVNSEPIKFQIELQDGKGYLVTCYNLTTNKKVGELKGCTVEEFDEDWDDLLGDLYGDDEPLDESHQGRDFKKKLEEGNKLKKVLLATAMAAGLIGTTPKMHANTPKNSKGQQTTIALDSNKEIEKADLGSIKTYTGLVNQEYCPLIRDFIEEHLEDTKKEIVDASFIKMTKSNIIDSLSESFPESTDEEIEDVVDGIFIMALKGTGKKAKTKISPEAVPLFSEGWRDTAALFAK